MAIMYSIYCRYNKAAIEEGKRYLQSLPADSFYNAYLKTIVEGPDFKLIKQSEDMIEIVSYKGKRVYLFRYHRCCLVTVEQYEMFVSLAEKEKAGRAFYITSGSFDHSLVKANRNSMFLMGPRIFLIDSLHIIKKIIGLRRKWCNRQKNLSMLDLYMP